MTPEEQWIATAFPELTSVTKLGQGGQKLVFAATHPVDGHVVLKLIRTGQDPARVDREIQAVQKVDSRRVPRMLGAGVAAAPIGNVIWLREQRIPGQSLRSVLQKQALPLKDGLRLGVQMLEALADVDRSRIVHRDVKPDNIMLDAGGDFWLLDFGIARHLDLESLTATSPFGGVGTVGYAPPEQFHNRKREIDGRADLFALGITLFEALHGANPFLVGARDVLEVLRRVEQVPLPLRPIPGDKYGRVAQFVASLAQRRREHRPRRAADALQWAKELELELGKGE